MNSSATLFKSLPSVDKVLQSDSLTALIDQYGQEGTKLAARAQLDLLRAGIAEEKQDILDWLLSENFFTELCQSIQASVEAEFRSSLIPVFNLSGTVIHTNLGRSRLPEKAAQAMMLAATEATNLEFDLESGKRGDRDSHLEKLLCEVTGAEAATIVNNNAAAVLLVLNSLASGKEVIISRGELVEIGGAFRIPDVMKSASCILKEVGTTNRTHLKDYQKAISSDTALLMKVHTSNYEIQGFTNSVSDVELGGLAKEKGINFVFDLGSGTLVDLKQFGLPEEPTVRQIVEAGAELVTFSGDKLLGGPQAGIIVGKQELIDKIKSNPMKRALRVDKTTLAALAEVIKLYKDPARVANQVPLYRDLTRSLSEIEAVAQRVLPALKAALADIATARIVECKSQIGSGALPLDLLESKALVITPIAKKGETDLKLNQLAKSFRQLSKPVIGRINDGELYFDLRCLWDVEAFIGQLPRLST